MRFDNYLQEKKKWTIDQAAQELSKIGYIMTDKGDFDMKKMVATYEFILPNGKKKMMTDKEVLKLLKGIK